jgi:hypothetical protein
MAIDTCVENFSGAVLKALAASTRERGPHDDPRVPDTGWHSGRNTPEKPAAEAVADHQGPRSESRGQQLTEVGDPPAQRVEKKTVRRDTRIP